MQKSQAQPIDGNTGFHFFQFPRSIATQKNGLLSTIHSLESESNSDQSNCLSDYINVFYILLIIHITNCWFCRNTEALVSDGATTDSAVVAHVSEIHSSQRTLQVSISCTMVVTLLGYYLVINAVIFDIDSLSVSFYLFLVPRVNSTTKRSFGVSCVRFESPTTQTCLHRLTTS